MSVKFNLLQQYIHWAVFLYFDATIKSGISLQHYNTRRINGKRQIMIDEARVETHEKIASIGNRSCDSPGQLRVNNVNRCNAVFYVALCHFCCRTVDIAVRTS
jgi:hypothetical protein